MLTYRYRCFLPVVSVCPLKKRGGIQTGLLYGVTGFIQGIQVYSVGCDTLQTGRKGFQEVAVDR